MVLRLWANKRMSLASKSKRLIVICPQRNQTGGPEALHQLVDAARRQGYDARISYLRDSSPIVFSYTRYRFSLIDVKEITLDDHVIIPEVASSFLSKLNPQIQKHLWWLSWDNFSGDLGSLKKERNLIHHAQSFYAQKALELRGFSSFLLGDYLNEVFLKASKKKKLREPVILFNPSKGLFWTQKLQELMPGNVWIELKDKTPSQIRKVMLTSKVYIDFGHAPGLDRLPREALMCGLFVMTSQTGAFGFKEDWDIPSDFKFNFPKVSFDHQITNEEKAELIRAARLIEKLLEEREDGEKYLKTRAQIQRQKQDFFEQVMTLCENAKISRLQKKEFCTDLLRCFFYKLTSLIHPQRWKKKGRSLERSFRGFFQKKKKF